MSRIRRFALVATVVAGVLLWVSLPLHLRYGRYYPLAGLVAALISAAVPRGPRLANHAIGRVLLAGCVSLGVLAFIGIGWHDAGGTLAIEHDTMAMIVMLSWLPLGGIVCTLVIPGLRARAAYLGFLLSSASIAFVLPPHDDPVELILGLAVLGLVPALAARITGAIQGSRSARDGADLPDARVVE